MPKQASALLREKCAKQSLLVLFQLAVQPPQQRSRACRNKQNHKRCSQCIPEKISSNAAVADRRIAHSIDYEHFLSGTQAFHYREHCKQGEEKYSKRACSAFGT